MNIAIVFLFPVTLFAFLFSAASAAEKFDADAVIVSQGKAKVTFGDVDAYVQRIPEKDRAGFMDSPKRIENVLEGLLTQQQLAQAAREADLDKKPEYQQQLKLTQNEMLAKQAMVSFGANLKVPDLLPLAKETYESHKSDYSTPAKIDVKHVLVSTKTRSDEEALAIARDIINQAKVNQVSFDTLVQKYSDDPSKDTNNGLMEDAGSSKYDPAFSAGAEKLKREGEISLPVHSAFGYHVLKLVKRTPGQQKSFDEVRETLVSKLSAQYKDQQLRAYAASFSNLPMDANPSLVESLRDRYMPAAATPEAGDSSRR